MLVVLVVLVRKVQLRGRLLFMLPVVVVVLVQAQEVPADLMVSAVSVVVRKLTLAMARKIQVLAVAVVNIMLLAALVVPVSSLSALRW